MLRDYLLTRLCIEHFKSLKDIDLPLKHLNIFIGPNNSGKSSILQTLLLLKQSYSEQVTNYSQPFNFGSFQEVVFKKLPQLSIQIILEHPISLKLQEDFEIFNIKGTTLQTSFRLWHSPQDDHIYVNLLNDQKISQVSLYDNEKSDPISFSNDFRKNINSRAIGGSSSSTSKWLRFKRKIEPNKSIIQEIPEEYQKVKVLNRILQRVNLFYSLFFKKITYIPVERGAMSWTTPTQGSTPKNIEVNDRGNTLYNVLYHMIRREHTDTLSRIKKWAKEFGIHDLTPYPAEAPNPMCGVETLQQYSDEPFQLISMGFGTRQILYLLLQAIIARRNSIILIEEHEIHLHPAYQTKVIDFLLDIIINDNKQVLVTTHSEYLLLRLQNVILQRKIPIEEVGVFYVNLVEGQTQVKELKFSEEGSYDMPGFYDVTQNEYREWLQLKTKKISLNNLSEEVVKNQTTRSKEGGERL